MAASNKSWYFTLFDKPHLQNQDQQYAWQQECTQLLRTQAQTFNTFFDPCIDPVDHERMNRWYSSHRGQTELVRLVNYIWHHMSRYSELAMPAHDARHAMYKVPADAIEHTHAQGVRGWERIGVIGALLHDFGRWAEERLFGGPHNTAHHARMSYVLAREILMEFDLPILAKVHILNAILNHTRGAVPTDPMIHKIVVAADRAQLYGPERILRLIHHSIDIETGEFAHLYGPPKSGTLIANIEHYLTTRIFGPLFARADHFADIWEATYVFLILCDSSPQGHDRWRHVLTHQDTLPERFKGVPYMYFQNEARRQRPVNRCATRAFTNFLQSKHIAPNPKYIQDAMGKLQTVPTERLDDFGAAMTFMRQQQQHESARQMDGLSALRQIYEGEGDRLLVTLIDHVSDL